MRRIIALAIAATAVLASAACRGPEAPSAPATLPPTAVLGDGPSDSPSAPGGTAAPTTAPPPAPAYPSSAKAYAQAILAAWPSNVTKLGTLTSPLVQEQILEIPGPINQNWHYSRCDGAAGSSYCVFFNDPGDAITLKISNSLLGKAHAGVEVLFDQVTFPTDPVEYTKEFIGAWQDGNTYRMKILSNQTEVSYFTHYTPPAPGTDACFSGGAAGSQYVRIYNGDGLEYLLRLTSATLGKPHAIAGHNDPSGSNCI